MTASDAQPSLLGGKFLHNPQAIAWLMLSVAALGASTLFAILVASSRAPATAQLLPDHDFFHLALILHVTLGPVLWFLAFAMVLWNLALPKPDSTRSGKMWHTLGWVGFGLALLGSVAIVLVPLGSAGNAILSNYIPVLHTPLFLTGLTLFCSGFALSLMCVLRWLRPSRMPAQEKVLGWGLLAAALAGVVALESTVWSAAVLPENLLPAIYYEELFWGPGHILQSMHVLLMMVAWLILSRAANIPLRSTAKTQILLFIVALLPVLVAPLLYLLYIPGSAEFRSAFTGLMRWMIWPGVALLAVDITIGLIQRAREISRWSAVTWALALSILLLIIGLAIGMSIHENNAVVPAHYHATTGAITMAYLGIALALISRLGITTTVARWPVIAYGTGMLMMTAALGWAGFAGMTRKLPGSEKALEEYSPHLTVIAVGGTLVIIGGIGFVTIMLRNWLRTSTLPKWKTGLLLSVTGVTIALGLAYTLIPGSATNSPVPANFDPHSDLQRHMQEKQTAEADARFQQAVLMLHAKRYEEAIIALQRVLTLEPRLTEAHVNMGFALLGLQRYGAARNAFEIAIDIRATQANAYYGWALAMKGLKDTEGAIGAMRSYIHLSAPDDPYLNKARADLAEWEKARGRRPGNELPSVKANQPE